MKKNTLLLIMIFLLTAVLYSQAGVSGLSANPESALGSSIHRQINPDTNGPQTPWHNLSKSEKLLHLEAFIEGVYRSAKLAAENEMYKSSSTEIYFQRVQILYDKIKQGDIDTLINKIDKYFGWHDGQDVEFGHVMHGAIQYATNYWLIKVG